MRYVYYGYSRYKNLFSSVGYDIVIIDNMFNNVSISVANDICYTTGAEVHKVLCVITKLVTVIVCMLKTISWQQISTTVS